MGLLGPEGDHLQLHYSIELNSFTGEGSNGIPPPRQTDAVSSSVTIPDGHTIVVGGLKRQDHGESTAMVPLLGRLPFIKHLFRSHTTTDTQTTLFIFIKPIILRVDRFEDLKFLSQLDRSKAGLPGDFPSSEPVVVR